MASENALRCRRCGHPLKNNPRGNIGPECIKKGETTRSLGLRGLEEVAADQQAHPGTRDYARLVAARLEEGRRLTPRMSRYLKEQAARMRPQQDQQATLGATA